MATQCQQKFGFTPCLAGAKFQFIPRRRNGYFCGPDSTRAIVPDDTVLSQIVSLSMLERAW